jgi:hypothetical protein
MIQKLLLATLLSGFIQPLLAQDYMEDITNKTCECIELISDTADKEMISLQVGLCFLEASSPYKKQLKKDHNIDFSNIDTDAERLGEIIGIHMATTCPEGLLKMVELMEIDLEEVAADEYNPTTNDFTTIVGSIYEIKKGRFIEFYVKSELGKTYKILWLDPITSNMDITLEYNNLLNQQVSVVFSEKEVFDPRIDEYRTIYIAQQIDLLNK